MKTGGFGIDGQKWLAAESLEQAFQLGLALDQTDSWLRWVR
jgi:hypothetical protein